MPLLCWCTRRALDNNLLDVMSLVFRMPIPSGRCFSGLCRGQMAKIASLQPHRVGPPPQARSLVAPLKGGNAEAAWDLTCSLGIHALEMHALGTHVAIAGAVWALTQCTMPTVNKGEHLRAMPMQGSMGVLFATAAKMVLSFLVNPPSCSFAKLLHDNCTC